MGFSLLYVSKSLLDLAEAKDEVAKIVSHAVARNAALNVTGALISTDIYFAQLLEGGQEEVELLMRGIEDDPRHMRVKTVRTAKEPRRFAGWSMAYSGNAGVVDRHIGPLFSPQPPANVAHLAMRLIGLMEELIHLTPG